MGTVSPFYTHRGLSNSTGSLDPLQHSHYINSQGAQQEMSLNNRKIRGNKTSKLNEGLKKLRRKSWSSIQHITSRVSSTSSELSAHDFMHISNNEEMKNKNTDTDTEIQERRNIGLSDDVTKLGLELVGKGVLDSPVTPAELSPELRREYQPQHTNESKVYPNSSHSSIETMANLSTQNLVIPPSPPPPHYFTDKLTSGTMKVRHYKLLEKLINNVEFGKSYGRDHSWMQQFIELGGFSLLRGQLKHVSSISIKSNEELKTEFCILSIIKCLILKDIGVPDFSLLIYADVVTYSLTSPKVETMNLATGILVLFVVNNGFVASKQFLKALKAMTEFCTSGRTSAINDDDNDNDNNSRSSSTNLVNDPFHFWIRNIIDVYNTSTQDGYQNYAPIEEYIMLSLFLIYEVIISFESINSRVLLRSNLEESGLLELLVIAKSLNNDPINDLIRQYYESKDDDRRELGSISSLDPMKKHDEDGVYSFEKLSFDIKRFKSMIIKGDHQHFIEELQNLTESVALSRKHNDDVKDAIFELLLSRFENDRQAVKVILKSYHLARCKENRHEQQIVPSLISTNYKNSTNVRPTMNHETNQQRYSVLQESDKSPRLNLTRKVSVTTTGTSDIGYLPAYNISSGIDIVRQPRQPVTSDLQPKKNEQEVICGNGKYVGLAQFGSGYGYIGSRIDGKINDKDVSAIPSSFFEPYDFYDISAYWGKYGTDAKDFLSDKHDEREDIPSSIPGDGSGNLTGNRGYLGAPHAGGKYIRIGTGNCDGSAEVDSKDSSNNNLDNSLVTRLPSIDNRLATGYGSDPISGSGEGLEHGLPKSCGVGKGLGPGLGFGLGKGLGPGSGSSQRSGEGSTESSSLGPDSGPSDEVNAGTHLAPLPSPPPPPPPLPAALTFANKAGQESKTSGTPLLPPPPPPPLPIALTFVSKAGDESKAKGLLLTPPPPPPPPPPLQLVHKKLKLPGSAPVPPPLPPPLPIQESILKKKEALEKIPKVVEKVLDPNVARLDHLRSLKRSQTKLKQFHWDKIDNIQNTLWGDSDDQTINRLLDERGILMDLERSFKVKEVKMRKPSVQVEKPKESKKVTFLPRDLKQTFAINLHQFNSLSETQFVEKVLSCDQAIISASSVIEFFNNESVMELTPNLMKDLGPYSTNYKLGFTKPKRDPNELERYDRIYVELCYNLAGYWNARARALFVAVTYESDFEAISTRLKLLEAGLDSLKSSKSLVDILALIKNIGNFMNDDSKIALGFKLSTLQRLRFLKDNSNKSSMLQYVEKTVRNHFPEYKDFTDELSAVKKISTLNIDDLEKSVDDFVALIRSCANQIRTGVLSDKSKLHPDDKIVEYFGKVLEKAQKNSETLSSHLENALDNLKSTMAFYAENYDDKGSKNSFFMKFVTFIGEYKQAHLQNIRMEEEENNKEKRQKILHEMMNKKTSVTSKESDIVEHLLDKLKEKKMSDCRRNAKEIVEKMTIPSLDVDDDTTDEGVDDLDDTFTAHDERKGDVDNENLCLENQDVGEVSSAPNIEHNAPYDAPSLGVATEEIETRQNIEYQIIAPVVEPILDEKVVVKRNEEDLNGQMLKTDEEEYSIGNYTTDDGIAEETEKTDSDHKVIPEYVKHEDDLIDL